MLERKFHIKRCFYREIEIDKFRPERGGIVPYTDDCIFFFGIDTRSGEISDFGGRINYKRGEDFLKGAIREFREESLGIFDPYLPKDFANCPVIYSDKVAIMFVYMKCKERTISQKFKERVVFESQPEMIDIIWLKFEQLNEILEKKSVKRFYRRIVSLINSIIQH